MGNYVERKVSKDIRKIVEDLGYFFVDLEYKKENADFVLNVLIDSRSGIGLDDCTAVSREVSDWLDETDPIEDSYVLMVSSSGLDRPLKSDADFERTIGQDLDISLYAPINGRQKMILELVSYDDEYLYFKDQDVDLKLERNQISKATKAIKI